MNIYKRERSTGQGKFTDNSFKKPTYLEERRISKLVVVLLLQTTQNKL
jgi:hypothetical protein